MKKVVRLTESDLARIVKRVIKEQEAPKQQPANDLARKEEIFNIAKSKMEACASKYPRIKSLVTNMGDVSNLSSVLWMSVAPDLLLTDNQIQIKKEYKAFEQCIKNIRV